MKFIRKIFILMIIIFSSTLVGCGKSIDDVEEIVLSVEPAFTESMQKYIDSEIEAQVDIFTSNSYETFIEEAVAGYFNEDTFIDKKEEVEKISVKLENGEKIKEDSYEAMECIAFNRFLIKTVKETSDQYLKTILDKAATVDTNIGEALNVLIRCMKVNIHTDNIFYDKVSEIIVSEIKNAFSEEYMTEIVGSVIAGVVEANSLTREQVQWDSLKLNQTEYIDWLNKYDDEYRNLIKALEDNIIIMESTKTLGVYQEVSLYAHLFRMGHSREWNTEDIIIK